MRKVVVFVVFVVVAMISVAQETLDLNDYYRYPVSVGAGFRQLTPFSDFASSFVVQEFSGAVRRPLEAYPLFFIGARLGLIQFDSQDPILPDKWDHQHFYLAPAFGVSQRLSKEFELGAEVSVGVSQSVFPSALAEPVGSLNLLAGVEAKLSLNPSYSVSIDIVPGVRYVRSFSEFHEYDGLSFGFGLAAHFRFGSDPDSAESLIRALRFSEVNLPDAFAAMQSYYVQHPLGTVTITNTERQPITDVSIAFFQPGYMDSPTQSATIAEMAPGETREIGLLASFNDAVFSRQGITPLNGEIIASYSLRGRPADQRQTVTYDLHDKTALTWDDDEKVGAFITPADSALRNYASFIRRAGNDSLSSGLSESLQTAMMAYNALAEIGILYQVDPSSPFTQVQENNYLVDSISLPRDTLVRIAGDCDDLTVLFASLLESVGVDTAFITVPGHIYVAVNTGVDSRNFRTVHPDRGMTIELDGQLWVPVEVTLIGRDSFSAAWRTGIELWDRYSATAGAFGFYRTREAQQKYRPVGLRELDLGLQYGNAARINTAFKDDLARLSDTILADYKSVAEGENDPNDWNRYGVAAGRLGRYEVAESAFRTASRLDRNLLGPRINLGAVGYLQGNYTTALLAFQDAERILTNRESASGSETLSVVLLNISKSYHALEKYDLASQYYERAAGMSPETAGEFAYLANSGAAEGARASEAGQGPQILFVTDEEE